MRVWFSLLLLPLSISVQAVDDCDQHCMRVNTRMQLNAKTSVWAQQCGHPQLAFDLQAATFTYIAAMVAPDEYAAVSDHFNKLVVSETRWRGQSSTPPSKQHCETFLRGARSELKETRRLIDRAR